jgi:hypothetical protein
MGTDPIIAPQSDTRRYEAIVRISEAIAACREPEQLATTLADEIGKFLNFDHLYLVVLKESSKEIEYLHSSTLADKRTTNIEDHGFMKYRSDV